MLRSFKNTFYIGNKGFIVFNRTGLGGGPETYNNLCVLPPNMLNQKFFSIWFVWLTALIIVSAVMLVLRVAIVFSSEIRELMLNLVYGLNISNMVTSEPVSYTHLTLPTNREV